MILYGKSAAPGVVVGPILKVEKMPDFIPENRGADVDSELARLKSAVEAARQEIIGIEKSVRDSAGQEHADIFGAHLLMLDDPEFLGEVETRVREQKVNAEFALREVATRLEETLRRLKNRYMQERAQDVKDVAQRLMGHLTGIKAPDLSRLTEDVVLVAHDLTPSDTAMMNRAKVLGILTDIGGKTSHTAILARSLEVPAVLGLQTISEVAKDGDWVCFDGNSGEVHLNPGKETLEEYRIRRQQFAALKKDLEALRGLPSVTLDGHSVHLVANVATPEDTPTLLRHDAEGVGLFRTEFLFMDRKDAPSEEEQLTAYRSVLSGVGHRRVIIRTFDIGGDKAIPFLKMPKEDNPFLGMRAIRYCLQTEGQGLFRTQLRALLRASPFGQLGIMFPLITNLEELLAAKKILAEVRSDLIREGVTVADRIEIGIMIEVPAAAIISDELAKHVDFMSIGTNDLIQYSCAVDRLSPSVQHLYDPFHPGVLRLVQMVVENGHREGAWVGMCGEMAGSPEMIPLLVGLGLDELSMTPASLLLARKVIRQNTFKDCQAMAQKALQLSSGPDIERLLGDWATSHAQNL